MFATKKLTFAGYSFTDKGTHPDPPKVESVKNAKSPANATEVRSFLGLVNLCSQFIKDYPTLTEPLRQLTRKGEIFVWNEK